MSSRLKGTIFGPARAGGSPPFYSRVRLATPACLTSVINATRLLAALLGLSCLTAGVAPGQTLSPRKVLGRYQQFVWQDQHGLPQNTVSSIVRTRDGYLWLATAEGIARFDGVRFTVFDSSNTPEIRTSFTSALLEDREGSLWVGTNGGGLNRFKDGRFTLYTSREGLSDDRVTCLFEDRAGNLWVGTDGGGLNRFKDGRFIVYTTKDGLPDNHIWALTEDTAGGLWVGAFGGLARYRDGSFTDYTMRSGRVLDRVRSVYWDHAETLWVGTDGGLSRIKDGRFTVYSAKDGLTNARVRALTQDREGNIWVGTYGGLYRYRDGRFDAYTSQDGLSDDFVRAIYQDPGGDLWVGTDGGGLNQLRDGRIGVLTTQDGLSHDVVRAVYEDAAGNLWMGTEGGGLNQFKDGKFTVYTTRDGLLTNTVLAISEDSRGNLWIGAGDNVCLFREGRCTNYRIDDGLANNVIVTLLGDRAGNLWIGSRYGGLSLFRDGRFTAFKKGDGLADNYVLSLYEDRAGALWIGTNGGMSRFKDGRFTTWTTADGLPSNQVLSFYEDRAGALWISTQNGGLVRFKDGKFSTITAKDGLYDNLAFQMLEDDGGNLWMSCNKGIYRASLQELNDFADGRVAAVTSFAYGVADGMLSRECNGASPAGWKARDGRLWFPTIKGVAVVDPRRRNTEPPLVTIEGVTVNREARPVGQPVRLAPGQTGLEIQYTGLSWAKPQQIKFKYQLVGLEQGWVDAGTRRTAYYSHLPPGEYTFRVIADNGEGVWNTEGKSLRVVVLPPFYRTWWFVALASLGAAGLVFLLYQYRVSQLRRARAVQQAFSRQLIVSQESERKRIAAELHDSLGQHLVVVKNLALMLLQAPSGNDETRRQVEEISAEASQALGEVRAISYNLRPHQLDRIGLTRAVEALIRTAAASSGITFTADVDQIDGALPKEAEINFYRIVQESLNNIVKHAHATEAGVTIRRDANRLLLTVRDNGKGFTPGAATADGRPGGFGLLGISERAQLLGGSPSIHSAPGQGTTVTVAIELRGDRHGR